jgi:bifunctional NMN adenylyltransferase/nudix hydrolase
VPFLLDFILFLVYNVKAKDMNKLGVIVGRFQIDELTQGHKQLIETAMSECDNVLIILGEAPARLTTDNPIPHFIRRQMILDFAPEVLVESLSDTSTDYAWYKRLNSKISTWSSRLQIEDSNVVLYGSRDSFLGRYEGKYSTRYVDEVTDVSATLYRNSVVKSIIKGTRKATKDLLAGIIFASHYKFPVSYQAVDVAMYKRIGEDLIVLLGRKPGETKYRFPGGIVDPLDNDMNCGNLLELSAARELFEETNNVVNPNDMEYIGSWRTNDYRYIRGVDKLATALFAIDVTDYDKPYTNIVGEGFPGDDLCETKWFIVKDFNPTTQLMPGHINLYKTLLTKIKQ